MCPISRWNSYILSKVSISFLFCGNQNYTQYTKYGRTKILYIGHKFQLLYSVPTDKDKHAVHFFKSFYPFVSCYLQPETLCISIGLPFPVYFPLAFGLPKYTLILAGLNSICLFDSPTNLNFIVSFDNLPCYPQFHQFSGNLQAYCIAFIFI